MPLENLSSRRKTKIVCTIGPATSSEVMLKRLIKQGMDCARLNFSHGSHSEHLETIRNIRKASREAQRQIAIIQDLPGPKFRIGKIKNDSVRLKKGAEIFLVTDAEASDDETKIPLRQHDLPKFVSHGSTIFLSDGTIKLKVEGSSDSEIKCKVLVGGVLFSGKGVNIPKLATDFETFTEADRKHVLFGLKNDVDFVAVSFVRNESDMVTAKKFIEANSRRGRLDLPWVIAKIEKREALKSLDKIIEVSDVVMVARGDLGVENPIAEVPMIQKTIISHCNARAVPVITATQMLESMVQNPSPTRAEVTDVANAILDGTDAVMLSEETAVGKYPLECVQVLHNVALNAESRMLREGFPRYNFLYQGSSVTDVTSFAAIGMSQDVGAKLLITPTESGQVVSRLARFKPKAPVIALTSRERTVRKLKVVWGVRPLHIENKDEAGGKSPRNLGELLKMSIRTLGKNNLVAPGDKLVVFCDSIEFFGQEGNLLFMTEAKLN